MPCSNRLLGARVTDVDANIEERKGTTSVFNGPPPVIQTLETPEDEAAAVSKWLKERVGNDSVRPEEVGIFLRDLDQLQRTECALRQAGLEWQIFDHCPKIACDRVSVGSMRLAKGLEFRAVAVMACDDEVLPSQERIESAADDSDLEEIYNTERHLVYVACTRARDFLHISGVKPASEFLDDISK